MSRYVIIGAGAIGALLAAQFELAGIETVLVARGRNLAAIRAGGVTVRRPASTDVVAVEVVGGPDELRLRADDVLVLATKTQDAEAALAQWAWVPVYPAASDAEPVGLGADLPILTFQNGLITEESALRRFARVYGVTIGVAASHLVPGEVVSPSFPLIGVLSIGGYPDRADAAQEAYADDLRRAGYGVLSVPDISAWKAGKLLGNVANGLDVLRGTPQQRERARDLLRAEAEAVYAAAGVDAADTSAWSRSFTLRIDPVPGHVLGRLSTWQSFERGASSEVDHLNGEIVLLGRRHGVPTPVNERLQRLLGAQALAGLGPGARSLDDLGVSTHDAVPAVNAGQVG